MRANENGRGNRRLVLTVAMVAVVALGVAPVFAASLGPIDFEAPTYATGSVDGQDGWSKTGPYDSEVVSQTVYPSFGNQTFRISNAVTSGSFGDHAISPSLSDAAGESGADGGSLSAAPTSAYFEASLDFASAVPSAEQPGLTLNISPDRGDGARMSYVGLRDVSDGLEVFFYDYQVGVGGPTACDGTFVLTSVASGLDRTIPHDVRVQMWFADGPSNDVVTVTVDGTATHTGTSWEDYFTGCEAQPTRTVDSLIFLTRGPASPGTAGAGFYLDNITMTTESPGPTSRDDCKKGGWEDYGFSNQGQCIRFVQTGKDSR